MKRVGLYFFCIPLTKKRFACSIGKNLNVLCTANNNLTIEGEWNGECEKEESIDY